MMDSVAVAVAGSVLNSNCSSSSSSSSSSSGYGSATTTPTTPLGTYELHSANETPPTGTGTAAAIASNTSLPSVSSSVTVAAVAPFFNEAALVANSSERQRQYYHQSYAAIPPTIGTTSYSGAMAQHPSLYDPYLANSASSSLYSHRMGSTSATALPSQSGVGRERVAMQRPPQVNFIKTNSNKTDDSAISRSASSKPKAAATAFYAQPTINEANFGTAPYYDTYKHKMPTKLPNAAPDYPYYGNSCVIGTGSGSHLQNAAAAAAAAASYQQQQYYAAAKSQLQEATYGVTASTVKQQQQQQHQQQQQQQAHQTSSRQYPHPPSAAFYPTSSRESQSASATSAYYEKYMYPTNTPTAITNTTPPYPPSHHRLPSSHELSSDAYRKSTAWHWNMEYSRTLAPQTADNLSPTTNTTAYYHQPSSAPTGRDPFYGKYDKYNPTGPPPSYYQPYMPTPGTIRNIWPGVTHQHQHQPQHHPHSHSHLASPHVLPSNERVPHHRGAAPTAVSNPTHSHAAGSHHFLSPMMNTNSNTRPYCTQSPYQQQNSYPRVTTQHQMPNTYIPPVHPQQCNYASSSVDYGKYSNFASEYGVHGSKMVKNSDLYLGPQLDSNPLTHTPSHLNYGYVTTNPRYDPSTTVTGRPISPTFYNDLNISSSYSTYPTIPTQTTMNQHQQHAAVSAMGPQTMGFCQQHNIMQPSKAALIDYRKAVEAPQTSQRGGDCLLATSDNEFSMTVRSAPTVDCIEYNSGSNRNSLMHSTTMEQLANTTENTEKGANTKNLSLRDFLSTWNEDEEDFTNSEELNFMQTESQNCSESSIATVTPTAQVLPYKPVAPASSQQQIAENHLQYKNSFNTRPKIHVGITVDGAMDVETNQYINLPDIIIDIEKSGNMPSTPAVQPVAKEISLDSFDVEKEIDELKCKSTSEIQIISQSRKEDEDNECERNIEKCSNEPNELLNLVKIDTKTDESIIENQKSSDIVNNDDQTVSTTSTLKDQRSVESSPPLFDNPEQFLKEIECDENNHSNQSTFEKEYETFINKINNDDIKVKSDHSNESATNAEWIQNVDNRSLTPKGSQEMEKSMLGMDLKNIEHDKEKEKDMTQNINYFSKFHKRKRKLIEAANYSEKKPKEDVISNIAETQNSDIDLKEDKNVGIKLERLTTNIASSTCSNRKYKNKVQLLRYHKILKNIQRDRCVKKNTINTSLLLQKRITKLRERRLPLIKRQSIKRYSNYTDYRKANIFNPKSLKTLSVFAVNTKTFRQRLLKDYQRLSDMRAYNQTFNKHSNGLVNVNSENTVSNIAKANEYEHNKMGAEQNAERSQILTPEQSTISGNLDLLKQDFQMTDKNIINSNINNNNNLNYAQSQNDLEKSNADRNNPSIEMEIKHSRLRSRSNSNTSSTSSSSSGSGSSSSSSSSSSSTSSSSSSSSSSSHKNSNASSRRSSVSEAQSDFNELEALEKELTQQHFEENELTQETYKRIFDNNESRLDAKLHTDDTEAPTKSITTSDIVDLKRILESDHEESDEGTSNPVDPLMINKDEFKIEHKNVGSKIVALNPDNSTCDFKPPSPTEELDEKEKEVNVSTFKTENDVHLCEKNCMNERSSSIIEKTISGNLVTNELVCRENREFNIDFKPNSTDIRENIPKPLIDEIINHKTDTKISKLSDLCKIALNQSIQKSNATTTLTTTHVDTDPTLKVEENTLNIITNADNVEVSSEISRELSVEEALAEMYRQAGVPSDPEDNEEKDDAQDVVLINLEEILDGDSDVYVLQCDMNENILSVVASHENIGEHVEMSSTDSSTQLQLVEVLNGDLVESTCDLVNEHDRTVGNESITDELASIEIAQTTTQRTTSAEAVAVAVTIPTATETMQYDLADLSIAIHHEEIVPDNYRKYEKEKFLKYLHTKYVQRSISKFYHANNILKKYKRYWSKKSKH